MNDPRYHHPGGDLYTQWMYRVAAMDTDENGVLVGESVEFPPRVNVSWRTVEEMEGARAVRRLVRGASGLRGEVKGEAAAEGEGEKEEDDDGEVRGRKVSREKEGTGKKKLSGEGAWWVKEDGG